MSKDTQLQVQSRAIWNLYDQYKKEQFIVNRRYQRKLVWSIDEKRKLIDSVVKNLPIPLILVAQADKNKSEIIDGLQRLNAFFSFVENEFSYNGEYFDLDTLGDTKALKDDGKLEQKTPIMPREMSKKVVNYEIPVSVYKSPQENDVDEVFRRINSSGRKLSSQEIRQAGITNQIADLVRLISSDIRQDATLDNKPELSKMPRLSITDGDLPYGINKNDIFWVQNGILPKKTIRQSRDEELVLDLLLDMLIDPLPASGIRHRDAVYSMDEDSSTDGKASINLDSLISGIGIKEIRHRFNKVIDVFKQIQSTSGKPLNEWIVGQKNSSTGIPRYFQATFIPIYKIMFHEGKRLTNIEGLTNNLRNYWDVHPLETRGSDFSLKKKIGAYGDLSDIIKKYFTEPSDSLGRIAEEIRTEFEANLQAMVGESALLELKSTIFKEKDDGDGYVLNTILFDRILKTCTAMANYKPNSVGFVYIGIADSFEAAKKLERKNNTPTINLSGFPITGLQSYFSQNGISYDEAMRQIIERVQSCKNISNREFLKELTRDIEGFTYKDRVLIKIKVKSQPEPVSWDDYFYQRRGSSTQKLTGDELTKLMQEFFVSSQMRV